MKLIVLFAICSVLVFVCADSYRYRRDKNHSNNHNRHAGNGHHSDHSGRRSHGKHSGGYRRKNYHHRGKSTVTLPSGGSTKIVKPRESRYICRKKSDLVTMKPTDKRWKNEYDTVKKEMESTNKNHGVTYNIVKIQKIFNPCLWRRYSHRRDDIYDEVKTTNERMLFHGSPKAKRLAYYGFDERYASAGGYFGAGIYFADRSSKSHDYAKPQPDGNRYMLLCRVTLGKTHKESGQPNRFAHAPVGFQSVVGALSDTEYIVYRGEQAYPAYLITYT